MSTTATNGHVNGHADPIPDDVMQAALAVQRIPLGRNVSGRVRKLAEHAPGDWPDLIEFVEQSAPDRREAAIKQWLNGHESRHPETARAMRRALDAAAVRVVAEPDEPPDPDAPRRWTLPVIGSAAFAAATYVRTWLVKNLLVAGQPCIIGGPKKALKTSLMVDMAIALGLALRFLDRFEVPRPMKVLFLSGESGDATIQETARRVCRARGIDLADLEGQVFWGFKLPSLSDPEQLEALAEFIRENGVEVVIIDPLYLCLLTGDRRLDASNLFDVGPLLARITEACLGAGATPLLVHHLRKNRESPHAAPELDDLAFAGVQEFARQWFLIARRETYQPGTGEHKLWLSVGGSAGQSGCWALDISEGVIDDDFGGRDWRVTVAGATEARVEAQQQQAEAKAQQKAEADRAKEQARLNKLAGDAGEALARLRQMGPATQRKWRDRLGWNSNRFGPVVEHLLAEGLIRPAEVPVEAGKRRWMQAGFEAVPEGQELTWDNVGQPGILPMNPTLDPTGTNLGRDGLSLPEGESPSSPRLGHGSGGGGVPPGTWDDDEAEGSPRFRDDGEGGDA